MSKVSSDSAGGSRVNPAIADLVPSDPLELIAWAGFINYLAGNPESVEAFRADTGCDWQPPRTALDRMIDEATGHDLDFMRRFLVWANELWGEWEEEG